MSKIKETTPIVETIEETTPTETVEETPVVKNVSVYIGKIRDCQRLNVRENPDLKAKVVCVLNKDSEVTVDKSGSTKEFYKVCTSDNVSGYCMKKYLSIKKSEA